jgi:mannose-6-phosphate isomerase
MPPLSFAPLFRRARWGGRRLATLLGKPIGPEPDYAESWELADHGADQSVVAVGPFAGWTLARLVAERNADLFGRHAGLAQFPLLAKFLDAHDRLSVQVHPDDAQARTFDPRENGKTEAWVVVAAEPGSRLFAGLKANVDRESLTAALPRAEQDPRSIEDWLHSFEVRAGDCVIVPAGTVHAIGEGVVVAEIQQSSDLTFRLSDWGRMGSDGRPRALHVAESLACIDFARGPLAPVVCEDAVEGRGSRVEGQRRPGAAHAASNLPEASGGREPPGSSIEVQASRGEGPTCDAICFDSSERLVRCPQFELIRRRVTAARPVPAEDRFRIWVGLAGSGRLEWDDSTLDCGLGRTLLRPAALPPCRVVPTSDTLVLLEARLP